MRSLAGVLLIAAGCAGPTRALPREILVAIAQPLVVPGDVAANLDRMEPLIAEAARRGARVVTFSEAGITGWDLEGRGATAALSLEDPALRRVDAMARTHDIVVVAGFFERLDGRVHNTLLAFLPGGRRAVQRKFLLTETETGRGATPAPRAREGFEVDGFRIALMISTETRTPGVYEEIAARGHDAVVVVSAGGGSARIGMRQADLDDEEARAKYARMTATTLSETALAGCLRLRLSKISCNQAGWDEASGYFHPGGSSVIDKTGEPTAVIAPRFVFEHLRPDLAVGAISR